MVTAMATALSRERGEGHPGGGQTAPVVKNREKKGLSPIFSRNSQEEQEPRCALPRQPKALPRISYLRTHYYVLLVPSKWGYSFLEHS